MAATTSSRERRCSTGVEPVHQATSKSMLLLANSRAKTWTSSVVDTVSHAATASWMTVRALSTSSP